MRKRNSLGVTMKSSSLGNDNSRPLGPRPAAGLGLTRFDGSSWIFKLVLSVVLLGCHWSFGVGGSELQAQQPDLVGGSTTGEAFVSDAIKARQEVNIAMEAIAKQAKKADRKQFSDQTTNQIRMQIDTVNDLDNALKTVQGQRGERLAKLRSEIDLLLLQIKGLKDAKIARQAAAEKKNVKQASDQNPTKSEPNIGSEKKTVGVEKNGSSKPNVDPPEPSLPSAQDLNKKDAVENSIFLAKKDPADKMGLANSLVAIQSYDTAIRILTELLADQTIDDGQRNWINYQLARCHRAKKTFQEAEVHLRHAANGKIKDISSVTSIWWLDRVAEQKLLSESLSKMDEQLQLLGDDDDSDE
jgi:hypothetical protein